MFRATDTYDVTNHMQGNLCFNKCPIVADTPFPGAVVVVVGGRGGGGGGADAVKGSDKTDCDECNIKS